MAKSILLDGFSTEVELAVKLGKTPRTLRSWRSLRMGPPWIEMGATILYRDAAVLAWLESQERKPVRSRRAA